MLLEAAPLECRNIGPGQLEPLPVRSPVGETPMPIGFNAGGVVRRDDVHKLGLVGERDPDFFHAALKLIAAPDLVMSARLDQVDRTISRPVRWARRGNGRGVWQNGRDVRELRVRANPLAQSLGEPDTAKGV